MFGLKVWQKNLQAQQQMKCQTTGNNSNHPRPICDSLSWAVTDQHLPVGTHSNAGVYFHAYFINH